MFALAGTEFDNAERFHLTRVQRIVQGKGSVPLAQREFLCLHVVPFGFGPRAKILDLTSIERGSDHFLPPGGTAAFDWFYNTDGFVFRRGNDACHGYTQIFRGGAVEGTKTLHVRQRVHDVREPVIVNTAIRQDFTRAATHYVGGLRSMGNGGPWIVMLSVVGIASCRFAERDASVGEPGMGGIMVDAQLTLPPVLIDQQTMVRDIYQGMRPMYDVLAHAANSARAPSTWD